MTKYRMSWEIILFILIAPTVVYSQKRTLPKTTYTTDNGLVYNTIRTISQDQTGFLWITTFDGISRFDGYEFRNYYNIPDDTTSLTDIDLYKECIDKNNNVWVLGPGNLYRYDRARDRFMIWNLFPFDQKGIADAWISLDKNSSLWLLLNRRLYKYDNSKNRFTMYPIKDRTGNFNNYIRFEIDNRNNFWFFNETLMFKGGVKKGPSDEEHCIEIEKAFPFLKQIQIYLDIIPRYEFSTAFNNTTWISSQYGLFRISANDSVVRPHEGIIKQEEAIGIDQLRWSSKTTGFHMYLPASDKIIWLPPSEAGWVNTSYYADNVIWTGSNGMGLKTDGLNKFLLTPDCFRHYLDQKTTGKKLSFFSILKDKNENLWAAERNSSFLYCIRPDGNIIKSLFIPEREFKNGGHIRSMIDVNGKIWVGYLRSLLYRFDPDAIPAGPNHVIVEKSDYFNNLDTIRSFRNMCLKKDGTVAVSSYPNLYIVNPSEKAALVFTKYLGLETYSLFEGPSGELWMGGSWGIFFHFNPKSHKIKKIQLNQYRYNIESIVETDSNTLWLGMLGGGIVKYLKNEQQTTFFTTRNGLANNMVYNILMDKRKNLWISTNKGISRLNTQTLQFRNFGLTDGLMIEEFNSDAAYRSENGELFFGGVGGVVGFFPDSLDKQQESLNMPLIITDAKVSGNPNLLRRDPYDLKELILPKGTTNIELTFACLDYQYSEKIRYKYRMIGLSDVWTETDCRHRSVNFSGLSAGEYQFEVMANDINGNWSRYNAITITIPPFFYQTISFKALSLLIFILLILLFYFMQMRQLRQKEYRKQVALKLESLRSQLNPHFIFNSLNSINYFISANDKISANRYISGFSRLMRSILENASAEYIPFEKEIQSLEDYCKLEHLRFEEKFEYQINIHPGLNPVNIDIAPTMVQPFVENAIWHGVRSLVNKKGTVKITFSPGTNDYITCIVQDDGIGRNASADRKSEEQKTRRSRGIQIIRDRLEMIGAMRGINLNISMDDLYPGQHETGTIVTILIPIKPENR